MLKRVGFGMILIVLSLIASFAMDAAAHLEDGHTIPCMFNDAILLKGDMLQPVAQNFLLLLIQLFLSALAHVLIYTSVFEFFCSQSPHSMKGLLIGLLYSIKGLYQLLATLVVVPILGLEYFDIPLRPISCGFYYYLVNLVLGSDCCDGVCVGG